jgi:hypothetical protein
MESLRGETGDFGRNLGKWGRGLKRLDRGRGYSVPGRLRTHVLGVAGRVNSEAKRYLDRALPVRSSWLP